MLSRMSLGPPRPSASIRAKEESAREMQAVTKAYAEQRNIAEPPYELLELIGKGSFGRVFKSRHTGTEAIVAVKIVEIDAADFDAPPEEKDSTIKDTMHEISILTRLKESSAQNVNPIIEAFEFNTQFWIVTEYCPGGSVHTLMKASLQAGLEEYFIIPIARELAKSLRSIHLAGIVHRDIKCSNIFINEDGRLQLGDFGIAGILDTDFSKRSTVLGTPNWMPPEMVGKMFGTDAGAIEYGKEVDCWSYGCVIFEMATGSPPYAKVHPLDLSKHLRDNPVRLEEDKYSPELREFVRFCLRENPHDRPSAAQILEHPFVAGTEKSHPAKHLETLIERFFMWEQAGGQRTSLFNPMGAKGPELPSKFEHEEEWNFSTTDEFQRRISVMAPSLGGIAEADEFAITAGPTKVISAREKRLKEARIKRGGQLQQLFNLNSAPYKFGPPGQPGPPSTPALGPDLPLHGPDDRTGDRSSMIDLDDVVSANSSVVSLVDVDANTIRAGRLGGGDVSPATSKRTTLQWKFPTPTDGAGGADQATVLAGKRTTMQWKFPTDVPPADAAKRDTMAWTFATAMLDLGPDGAGGCVEEVPADLSTMSIDIQPTGGHGRLAGSPRLSIIDLDQALDSFIGAGPATASLSSSFTDVSTGDPFDLEVLDTPSSSVPEDANMTVKGPQPGPGLGHGHSASRVSDSNGSFSSPFFDSSVLFVSTSPASPSGDRPSFAGSNSSAGDLVRVGSRATLLSRPAPDSALSVRSDVDPPDGRLFQTNVPLPAPPSATALLPLSDASFFGPVEMTPHAVLDELTAEFGRLTGALADHFAISAAALERLEAEDDSWVQHAQAQLVPMLPQYPPGYPLGGRSARSSVSTGGRSGCFGLERVNNHSSHSNHSNHAAGVSVTDGVLGIVGGGGPVGIPVSVSVVGATAPVSPSIGGLPSSPPPFVTGPNGSGGAGGVGGTGGGMSGSGPGTVVSVSVAQAGS